LGLVQSTLFTVVMLQGTEVETHDLVKQLTEKVGKIRGRSCEARGATERDSHSRNLEPP
jgi:hypothetical protein